MNILHIAGTDLRGARFNGFAMKQAAAAHGHHIRLAVWDKQSTDPDVISLRHGIARWGQAALSRANRLLGLEDIFSPAALALLRHPWFAEADVVHAHLIDHDWLSLALTPYIARRRPLVLTVHSAIAATGGCYYPRECPRWRTGCNGPCPHPRGTSPMHRRTPALRWRIKRAAYRRADVTLVAASQWTNAYLSRGPLTRHLPRRIIPFGLDLDVFQPGDKAAARARLGIEPRETVLAFRGVDVNRDEVKGGAWLQRTLERLALPGPVTLLIVDDARSFLPLARRYRIIDRGWAPTDSELAATMRAADVFLMPSHAESFGMMAVEAMACGVPVIAGAGTSLPEVIHAPEGGITVASDDDHALAAAITQLVTQPALRARLSRAGRAIAEQHYALEPYVRRHLDLYAELHAQRARATARPAAAAPSIPRPALAGAPPSTAPGSVGARPRPNGARAAPVPVPSEEGIPPGLDLDGSSEAM